MILKIKDLVDEFFRKYDTFDMIKRHWGIRVEYTIFDLVYDYFEGSNYDLNNHIVSGQIREYDINYIRFHIIPNLCWIIYPISESPGEDSSIRYLTDQYKQKGPISFYKLLENDFSHYDKNILVNNGANSDIITYCKIDKKLPTMIKINKFKKMAESTQKVKYLFKLNDNDIIMYLKNEDVVKET